MSHVTDPWDLSPPELAVQHSPFVQLAAISPLAALAALDPAAAVVALSRQFDSLNPALNPATALDLFTAGWVLAHGVAHHGTYQPAPPPAQPSPAPTPAWPRLVAEWLSCIGPALHILPGHCEWRGGPKIGTTSAAVTPGKRKIPTYSESM